MQIDREWLERTLTGLVQIDSVNPTLTPGGGGETEISRFVLDRLTPFLPDVLTFEPEPGRISVLGVRAGTGGGKSLMLNAHYDTVGVDGMREPFSGAVREGKVYGRGSYDMKGSLAASMAAVKALADANAELRGDVMVAAVADEEYGSLGTADLIRHVKPDAAVVTEPTSLRVCLAHKGYLWIEVETVGRAAHGSRFDQGIDANMRMGRFLSGLDRLERSLRARKPHPLVGPPSLHAAMLTGGTGLSTYAASSKLQIERRTVPGETEAQVIAELQAIVDELKAEDPSFQATVRPYFVRQAFEVDRDAAIVRTVARATEQVLGRAAEFMGDTPWMDSALLAEAGVETVVIGPHGAGAHAEEEWVDLESVVQLAEILAKSAVDYCA